MLTTLVVAFFVRHVWRSSAPVARAPLRGQAAVEALLAQAEPWDL